MPGEIHHGESPMTCAEFDALLSDALDHTLAAAKLAAFHAHAQTCPACGPLFQEAEAGQRWLKSLEPVEPSAALVRNILEATTGTQPSWWERFRASVLAPMTAVARQPRFAMSFGMAFFSLSITLSLAGVRLGDLRHLDLRPGALKRQYYETSGKVVKYYENMRFVYEIESRMRQLKQAAPPPEPEPEEKEKNRHNNTSGQPDTNQERNYSQDGDQPVLASAPDDPPVVMVATYRRFV
ncbi:MAG TPA: zf-HC2 domain-containing protein [Terriglobales bacterium]|nr:zf-HC2 domain-containing protein [Terriglobales bacterium]